MERGRTAVPGYDASFYIPANVVHVAVNRANKPAVFTGSRNEPTAQESVVLYPEMDGRVP